MTPPQPHTSLPTPQNFTFQGFSRPFFFRNSVIGLSPTEVRYCTQSDISFTVPLPILPQITGSHPSCSQRSMNSCVPKLLSSVTPPQFVLTIFGRAARGPMPSRQWYSSAKQPPGHRTAATLIFFNASTTSLRIPRVLGMELFSPTQTPP